MHLTRLLLNLRSADARRDLGNAHNMHRRVMSAFPDEQLGDGARGKHGVLFRVDDVRGDTHVLVQSETAPDWGKLPIGYLRETFEPNPALADLSIQLCAQGGAAIAIPTARERYQTSWQERRGPPRQARGVGRL